MCTNFFLGCPLSRTVPTTAGRCDAVVTFNAPTPSDNCQVDETWREGLASGSQFSTGNVTVSYFANDTSGNIGECTFSVAVVDQEAPSISTLLSNSHLFRKHAQLSIYKILRKC